MSADDPRAGDNPPPLAGAQPPDPTGPAPTPPEAHPGRRRIAVNTAIFSIGTGLSRIAGLGREILASAYFATSGAFSAFTIAFQVPNLLRMLVADQAVTAAFVPVFTELLEQGKKREAFRLASTLLILITGVLGAISVLFVLLAPTLMPALTGGQFTPELDDLTVGLSQVLFAIVVLLGVNGLCLGILNAYDHFTVQSLAPLAWNLVIIGVLIALRPAFDGPEQLYAYAIGVLAGTVVQFAMAFPVLRRLGFRFRLAFDLRDPRLGQVFRLMLPVTISLGLINFVLVINSTLGSLVSPEAPRAIDAAYRIYMLPQGMFSIALATVLFPALTRYAVRRDLAGLRSTQGNGVRQILLLLVPAAALCAVLAEPMTRLIYEHGEFGPDSTDQVAEALFWFSFALPFNGINLLMTRTFFSLQRPWLPTNLALASVVFNTVVSLALYKPFGIAGLVSGTVAGNVAMTVGQVLYLRRAIDGVEGAETARTAVRILVATLLLGAVAYGTWYGLDRALGESLLAQLVAVGTAIVLSGLAYLGAVLAMRIPEARQLRSLLLRRGGDSAG